MLISSHNENDTDKDSSSKVGDDLDGTDTEKMGEDDAAKDWNDSKGEV